MKKQPSQRKLILRPAVLVCLGVLFAAMLIQQTGLAQSGQTLSVSNPDSSAYPAVTFYFWPIDPSGNFIADLTTTEIHVLENDREVKVTALNLIEPGTHVIFAINEGKTLSNSYSGETRMNRMKEVFTTWIKSESITTTDDFSLVTNNAVVQNQLAKPADWLQAMTDYNPDLRSATPSLNSLSQAMALIKSLPSTDHKARAILYITPLPDKNDLATLQEQATLAASANTRLFIWLIGPQTFASEDAAAVLKKAAADTGGAFFIFSGAETLPDLNTYLNPFSHEYQVTYQTSIQKSGTFTLQVQVSQKDFDSTSLKISFDIKAEAPNPIFLSPPEMLTLNWVKNADGKTWALTPDSYTVKYMLEFPDGHKRDLKAARLFVDGQMVYEVTTAPFDELKWDLSQYTESGNHSLQIFVEDSAGFTASTIKTPVLVKLNPKPQTAFQKFLDSINYITLAIVGLLILVGVLLLVVFRRKLLKQQSEKAIHKKTDDDPVKQAVIIDPMDYADTTGKEVPADWPRLPGAGKAPARLLPIGGDSQLPQRKHIALPLQDTVLGSDTVRCDIVLSGVTISPVHAKIFTDAAKHFYIADCGSTAGTWINYAPVSSQGAPLEHGDLINIGAYSFRFEEINPEGKTIQVLQYSGE